MVCKRIDELVFYSILIFSIILSFFVSYEFQAILLYAIIIVGLISAYYHKKGLAIIVPKNILIFAISLTVILIFTFDSLIIQFFPIILFFTLYLIRSIFIAILVLINNHKKSILTTPKKQKKIDKDKFRDEGKSKPRFQVEPETIPQAPIKKVEEKSKSKIGYSNPPSPKLGKSFIPPFKTSGGTILPPNTTPQEAYRFQDDTR